MTLPDRDLLAKLFRGHLSPLVADCICEQLESEEIFAQVAGDVMADDTFLGSLFRTQMSQTELSPEISRLIERFLAWKAAAGSGTVAGSGVPQPQPWVPQPGEPLAIAHFRIVRKLGQGGMGAVYLGEDPTLDRKAALKVMRLEYASNPEARERFLREARAAAALDHDNIVAIWQVGEDAGMPFIAMPFLIGESLEDRIQREPKSSLGTILKLAKEVAEGLAAAHERGMIHRDIKPANLWLEGQPNAKEPSKAFRRTKILDFGLARFAHGDVQLTSTGAILGTPAFMSPEQGRGQALDARSDLFSLGVVLYRMAVGELPFKGNTMMAILMSLGMDEPASPSSKNDRIPVAVSDLILRLLAKEPANRFQTAREVVDAVQRIIRKLTAKADGASSTTIPTQVAPEPATPPPPPKPATTFREPTPPPKPAPKAERRDATPPTTFFSVPKSKSKLSRRMKILLLASIVPVVLLSTYLAMSSPSGGSDRTPYATKPSIWAKATGPAPTTTAKDGYSYPTKAPTQIPILIAGADERYEITIVEERMEAYTYDEAVPVTTEKVVDGKTVSVTSTVKVTKVGTRSVRVPTTSLSETPPEIGEKRTVDGTVYTVSTSFEGLSYTRTTKTWPEIKVVPRKISTTKPREMPEIPRPYKVPSLDAIPNQPPTKPPFAPGQMPWTYKK